jgi:hypothetical protein
LFAPDPDGRAARICRWVLHGQVAQAEPCHWGKRVSPQRRHERAQGV